MDPKRALILLFLLCLLRFPPSSFAGVEQSLTHPEEVNEFLQKKDWPSLVLLLKPERGQNFEQDLILAKAYLSLERRFEAIQLLNEMAEGRKDERIVKLLDLASTQFFNQETANLYYEAVRYIGDLRWHEVKDKLDQALAKEPNQGLILVRKVQLSLIQGTKDLEEYLRLAQEVYPASPELRIFSGRAKYLADEGKEAIRIFSGLKEQMLQNDLTTEWWLEALFKAGKMSEINMLEKWLLKNHPHWSYSLSWFLKIEPRVPYSLLGSVSKEVIEQLEKNIGNFTALGPEKEMETKRSLYFWVGYFTDETLKTGFDQWIIQAKGTLLKQVNR